METSLPLAGFRVLDLTRFLAGPYCSMVLADLGADVIKLEQPDGGDDSRRYGPFVNGESYSFAQVNRGKRGVSLDLKDPRGAALARRLADSADLVVESFRPGVADRLGLGYQSLSSGRPDLLYCSISGFGQGQYIDIALTDALLAWTVWEAAALFSGGAVAGPTGTRHRLSTPYQAYRTKDGYVTIGAGSERLWRRTAEALGAPRWLDDPRFAGPAERMAHIDELETEIEALTGAEIDELISAGVAYDAHPDARDDGMSDSQ